MLSSQKIERKWLKDNRWDIFTRACAVAAGEEVYKDLSREVMDDLSNQLKTLGVANHPLFQKTLYNPIYLAGIVNKHPDIMNLQIEFVNGKFLLTVNNNPS